MRMKSNFTIVPNALIKDQTISLKAKGLYAYFASRGEDWRFYIEEIASHCKEGVKAVRTAMKELVESGYITQTRVNGDGGKYHYDYEIFEYPQVSSPHTPKRHTVTTATAKWHTNNKDNISNKEEVCNTQSCSDLSTRVVNGWNNIFNTNVKVDPALMNRVNSLVKNYSLDEIRDTFIKYHKVYSGKEYFYNVKHTLFDFLSIGDYKFHTFYHNDIDYFKSWDKEKKGATKMKVMIDGELKEI